MRYVNRLSLKVMTFFVVGVTSTVSVASDFYGALDTPCHPQSVITCSLPYPSDIYGYAYSASDTGMRLALPVGLIREELLADLPPSFTPQTVFNGSNGFSAATSVLFELDQAPDLNTVQEYDGNTVVAYNLDTGERIPLRVNINEYARSEQVAAPSQIIEVYPRSRWDFGNRYVVALTNNIKTELGDTFEPSAGFVQSAAADGSRLSNYYEPAFAFLESMGHSRDELNAITFFTVRSEEEVTGPIKMLTEYVYAQEHPIRDIDVSYPFIGPIGAVVKGEVLVHNFRGSDGNMDFNLAHAEAHWIEFRLALPRVAKTQQVPVAIYGHGLTLTKETYLIAAIPNASLGIATVSIDHPNHGGRAEKDGGLVDDIIHVQYVPVMVGMMTQSSVDAMSLLKALKTSFASLDVLPKRLWGSNGDGMPELDTNRIYYHGASLGGVLGSTFVGLAPDLKGAFLQVTGVGITNILSASTLWETQFSALEPAAADGAEAMMLKAAMQHEIDYGDAINFVHYFRNPPANAIAKPVAVIVGLGDQVVSNHTSVALAEIAQLPHVGTELFPMPGVEKVDHFVDGYGVTQVMPLFNFTLGTLGGLLAHASFIRPDASAVLEAWIKEIILED